MLVHVFIKIIGGNLWIVQRSTLHKMINLPQHCIVLLDYQFNQTTITHLNLNILEHCNLSHICLQALNVDVRCVLLVRSELRCFVVFGASRMPGRLVFVLVLTFQIKFRYGFFSKVAQKVVYVKFFLLLNAESMHASRYEINVNP